MFAPHQPQTRPAQLSRPQMPRHYGHTNHRQSHSVTGLTRGSACWHASLSRNASRVRRATKSSGVSQYSWRTAKGREEVAAGRLQVRQTWQSCRPQATGAQYQSDGRGVPILLGLRGCACSAVLRQLTGNLPKVHRLPNRLPNGTRAQVDIKTVCARSYATSA